MDTIHDKFYGQVSDKKFSPAFRRKIYDSFAPVPAYDVEELASQSEWFNVQERQAKFIVNSVRVYEHFGYEWLIPLWDNALFEFWRHVPIDQRYKRRFYFSAIGQECAESTNESSAYKTLRNHIRENSVLRPLGRKVTRMMEYWTSSNNFEKMYTWHEYALVCLRGSELFCVNTMICRQQIAYCRRVVQKYEKT